MVSAVKSHGSKKIMRKASRKASRKTFKKTSKKNVRRMSGGAKARKTSRKTSRNANKTRNANKKVRKMKGGNPGSDSSDDKVWFIPPNTLTDAQLAKEIVKATNIDELIMVVKGYADPTNVNGTQTTLATLNKIKLKDAAWVAMNEQQKIEAIGIGSFSTPKVTPGPFYITRCGGIRDRVKLMIKKL